MHGTKDIWQRSWMSSWTEKFIIKTQNWEKQTSGCLLKKLPIWNANVSAVVQSPSHRVILLATNSMNIFIRFYLLRTHRVQLYNTSQSPIMDIIDVLQSNTLINISTRYLHRQHLKYHPHIDILISTVQWTKYASILRTLHRRRHNSRPR